VATCKACNRKVQFHGTFMVKPHKEIYFPCHNCSNELIEKNKYFNKLSGSYILVAGVILFAIWELNGS